MYDFSYLLYKQSNQPSWGSVTADSPGRVSSRLCCVPDWDPVDECISPGQWFWKFYCLEGVIKDKCNLIYLYFTAKISFPWYMFNINKDLKITYHITHSYFIECIQCVKDTVQIKDSEIMIGRQIRHLLYLIVTKVGLL